MLSIPLVDPVAEGLMVSVNMLFSVMTHISSQSQFSQHPATQLPGPFPISSVQHQHLAEIYMKCKSYTSSPAPLAIGRR